MTTLITSNFDSQDMADLAVMRLRRIGINFSVTRLEASGSQNSRAFLDGADIGFSKFHMNNTAFTSINGGTNSFPTAVPIATTGADKQLTNDKSILKIRVKSNDTSRARSIIRASNGYNISEGRL